MIQNPPRGRQTLRGSLSAVSGGSSTMISLEVKDDAFSGYGDSLGRRGLD
jgi:hypothetical protein